MIEAAVGGAIGAAGALAATFGTQYLSRRRKTQRVRAALLSELQSIEYDSSSASFDDAISSAIAKVDKDQIIPGNVFFDRTVYEGVSDDLAYLEEDEIEAVVEYYAKTKIWESRVRLSRNRDRSQVDLSKGETEVAVRTLRGLQRSRIHAIRTLTQNCDSFQSNSSSLSARNAE